MLFKRGVNMKSIQIVKNLTTLLLAMMALSVLSFADSAKEIESDANKALQKFYHEVPGGKKFLNQAKGYVIFPDINEAGFFFGGKYGEGVLRIQGKTKSYHSITAASVGMQMGLQNYSLIIAFTSDKALKDFILDDNDWETDMQTKIIMADWTTGKDADEIDYGTSMIGFAFDNTGMMGKFSMEGTKFEEINPDN